MKEKEPDKDLVERANKLRNGYFGNDNTLPIDIARFAQEVRDEIQEKLEDDFDDGYSAICKKLEAERKLGDELEKSLEEVLHMIKAQNIPDFNNHNHVIVYLAEQALTAHRKARKK